MYAPRVIADELVRVAKSLHPNPHSVLGPHPVASTRTGDATLSRGSSDGTAVRVLRPGARSVRIVTDAGSSATASPIGSAGIFEARFSGSVGPYRIEATDASGGTRSLRDPYAFGPTVGELDLHLFGEGKHLRIHHILGAHEREHEGVRGTSFAVWAPSALAVRVIGDFNDWSGTGFAMRKLSGGVWELFVPEIGEGALYKFEVVTRRGPIHKSDPFGRAMEIRPQTASRVTSSRYQFDDDEWMEARKSWRFANAPISIYEVHLPSWKRTPRAVAPGEPPHPPETSTRWLTYRELADRLVEHVRELGFTHIELLPIMEHPYDGSWGYQVSGYFAPTSRLGSPDDLKHFVDRCHRAGIGVILDWVPAHFPRDAAALGRFDGTPLFEHWDPRRGEHRQWETFVFDWGRPEVKNFLLASALHWIEEFHLDGLRVDAVASMLYLDYGASHAGEWEPNVHGGRENLEAVAFLRELNDTIHANHPGVVVCAEESTSWPGVTRPTYAGGLGFDLKWNMGWMHDTLGYFALDPIFRSFQHNLVTFAIWYAYSERFLLPLSHDEVVHLKRPLLGKMPGDDWQRRANLRSLYALMWAHPGKKLLFMGAELGQTTEWNFSTELEWELLQREEHLGLRRTLSDLNAIYRAEPALHELDDEPEGFRWIDANDASQSVLSFVRFPRSKLGSRATGTHIVVVGNFTPVVRRGYRIGVPRACNYREVLNTDASTYGGSNVGNYGVAVVEPVPSHGYPQSIVLSLPPLGVLYLAPVDVGEPTEAELERERPARGRSVEDVGADARATVDAMTRPVRDEPLDDLDLSAPESPTE